MFDESSGPEKLHPVATSRAHTARMALGAVLLVILVAFVVDNSETTNVGFVFGHADAPLFVVLLVTALIGAAMGWLVAYARRHRD